MADFSAPSFSLGLDLDLDPDLSTQEEPGDDEARDPREEPSPSPLLGASPSRSRRWVEEEGKDEVDGDLVGVKLEEDPPATIPALKRLKRGPPTSRLLETPPQPPPADPSTPYGAAQFSALADDIEEFSSQDDGVSRDEYYSRQIYSACSSSNFSLRGQSILTTLSTRKLNTPKIKENSSIPASVEASSNKKVFPRLTISPLRKIELLDSDSDDLSIDRDRCKGAKDVDTCPKTNGFAPAQCLSGAQPRKTEISSIKHPGENLWTDFSPKKNFNFATPALDNFCEEYFKAVKSAIVSERTKQHAAVSNSGVRLPADFVEVERHHQERCITNSAEHDRNLPDSQPPSHQYFYHTNVRIQKLVRQRLPNFLPLGDVRCIGSQQPNGETFDYMSQFALRKVPCQVHGASQEGFGVGSKGRPRNQKNVKGKELAVTSRTRVNPRSSSAIPKDAWKRRVHADGHSFGHWYTGPDGNKVYVTKKGQELSGQIAYKQYIKESGARFRKSRKKASGASKKITKR